MPPSSPPRLPCEEENPEPYSLIIVVCSGKIRLQHKASCYRGHDYLNRLNSLQGCTTVHPTRSDLQGGVHLVRECPMKVQYVDQRGGEWEIFKYLEEIQFSSGLF